ncbi:MAG: hypothetical protein Q9169_004268 [Polycauliona sp. 2 TL-2023]
MLDKQYHSDGIIAMVPLHMPLPLFSNQTRVMAIVKAMTLLKPEFEDDHLLQTCSEKLNKAYQGHALNQEDMDQLAQCLQYDECGSRSSVRKPNKDADHPTGTLPLATPELFDVGSDSDESHSSSQIDPRLLGTTTSREESLATDALRFAPTDAVTGFESEDEPMDSPELGSTTLHEDSSAPDTLRSPPAETLFCSVPTTLPRLRSQRQSEDLPAPVATYQTPAEMSTSKPQPVIAGSLEDSPSWARFSRVFFRSSDRRPS